MTTLRVAILSVLALSASGARPDMDLPAPLAAYHTWSQLTKDARPVSMELSRLCRTVSKNEAEKHRAESRRVHGEHAERYVRVYANPIAFAALEAGAKVLPMGAVIAKEKLLHPAGAEPDGLAFMEKGRAGQSAATGDWRFLYYPETSQASTEHCAACHRGEGAVDYVFTRIEGDTSRTRAR